MNAEAATSSPVPTATSTSTTASPAVEANTSCNGKTSEKQGMKRKRPSTRKREWARRMAEKKLEEEKMKQKLGLLPENLSNPLARSRPSAPLGLSRREPFQGLFMSPSTPAWKKGSFIPNPGVKYVLLLTDERFSRVPVSTGRHVFIADTNVHQPKKGKLKCDTPVVFRDFGEATRLLHKVEHSNVQILQVTIGRLALVFGFGEEIASGENFKQKIWSWLGLPEDFRFGAILIQAGRHDVENVKNPEGLLSCPAPSSFQDFLKRLFQALEKIAMNFGAEVQFLGPATHLMYSKLSGSSKPWMKELVKSLEEGFAKQLSESWDFEWTNRWCYNLLPDLPKVCWNVKNKSLNPLGLTQLAENLKSCLQKMLATPLGNHPVALFLARKWVCDLNLPQPSVPNCGSPAKRQVLEEGATLLRSELDLAQKPRVMEEEGSSIDESQRFQCAPELPFALSVNGQASTGKTIAVEMEALVTAVPNAAGQETLEEEAMRLLANIKQETLEEEAMRLLAHVKKEFCAGELDTPEDCGTCETALPLSNDEAPVTETVTPSFDSSNGLPVLPEDVDKSVVKNRTIKDEPMEAMELPNVPSSSDDHHAHGSSSAGDPFRGQKRSAGVCDGKSTPTSSPCGLTSSPSCPAKRKKITKH